MRLFAAIHAWLTSVYGELRKIRRLVVAGLVVAVIAAVLIAVGVTVLVTEFGLD